MEKRECNDRKVSFIILFIIILWSIYFLPFTFVSLLFLQGKGTGREGTYNKKKMKCLERKMMHQFLYPARPHTSHLAASLCGRAWRGRVERTGPVPFLWIGVGLSMQGFFSGSLRAPFLFVM